MMKFLIFSTFFFLGFLATIEVQSAKYDEDLASRLVYFAAATFVESTDKNGNDLTNQCFTKAFPRGTWTRDAMYDIPCQADHPNEKCQGLVASNADLKIIVFAFRGTAGNGQSVQAINDAMGTFKDFVIGDNIRLGYVYEYFSNLMPLVWANIKDILANPTYKDYTFYFTGHSLGGGMAALAALQARASDLVSDNQLQLYTFGEPRVGDYEVATNIQKYITLDYRVVNNRDPVPHIPFCRSGDASPCKKVNGFPYQHSQEIWYYEDMQTTNSGVNDFLICSSKDGEDTQCSDSIPDSQFISDGLDTKGADYHYHYFDHKIDEWGMNGCDLSDVTTSTTSMPPKSTPSTSISSVTITAKPTPSESAPTNSMPPESTTNGTAPPVIVTIVATSSEHPPTESTTSDHSGGNSPSFTKFSIFLSILFVLVKLL